MKKILQKIKRQVKILRGNFTKKIPVGRTDFDAYCTDIFFTYGIPDMPSYRQAIATMIMHLDPTKNSVKPVYFCRCIKKAMANEIAYSFIQEQKIIEKEKREKEAASNDKEVAVASN